MRSREAISDGEEIHRVSYLGRVDELNSQQNLFSGSSYARYQFLEVESRGAQVRVQVVPPLQKE